jgi:hypothetical protein
VNVIRHHVEPVEVWLHLLEIETTEIPVRSRLWGISFGGITWKRSTMKAGHLRVSN